MRSIFVLSLFVAAVAGRDGWSPKRIVGGSVTTIANYPDIAALLYADNLVSFTQWCGSTIINSRSLLTAAHCVYGYTQPQYYRVRVGSSFASSGGSVYTIERFIMHPDFNVQSFLDADVTIIRTVSPITFVNNAVQSGLFAGPNYVPADNSVVWAAGWGDIAVGGPPSEQLRHVQVWTVNQQICRERYGTMGLNITNNMLCSGWLDVGGRDQCQGDSGGPLYHNGVVVGVCSFGIDCADPFFPGVNARVSNYTTWIQANA